LHDFVAASLANAEYPGYLANSEFLQSDAEEQRIIDDDWAQYVEWLNRQ
jgi:hypothetical protein